MEKLTRLLRTMAAVGALLAGCAPRPWGPHEAPSDPGHDVSLPAAHVEYTTTPTPDGIRGGARAEQLAAKVREHFPDLELKTDGRLADFATRVILLAWERGQLPDTDEIDALARESGFVGPCPFVFGAPYANGDWQGLDGHLAQVPANLRFTHFGVAVFPAADGAQGAVALGALHLVLEPIPRHVRANQTLTIKGKIAGEYRDRRFIWTLPDGSTRPLVVDDAGALASTTEPLVPGVHRFEAVGVGPTGFEVLANFPVTAGPLTAAAAPLEQAVDESNPSQALLELMNRARARAKVGALVRTAVLDRVAQAHSADMVSSHFFGHDSPRTGKTDDRIRAGRVRLVLFGENVGRATSAGAVHRGLMDSAVHRRNLLDPRFTHVGIGVVVNPEEHPPSLTVTQVFGRFPGRLEDPADFASALLVEMNRARAEAKTASVSRNPGLDAAAAKIAARVAADPSLPAEQVDRVAQRSDFPNASGDVALLAFYPAVPEDVASVPYLIDPTVRSVGIAVVQVDATLETPRTNVALFVLEN